MERMREVIRGSLARSLRRLAEEDRLAAALPASCGSALAGHCTVIALDGQRVLRLQVDSGEWLPSLMAMRGVLQHDLQRVAGVSIRGLHFEVAGADPGAPAPRLGGATR